MGQGRRKRRRVERLGCNGSFGFHLGGFGRIKDAAGGPLTAAI